MHRPTVGIIALVLIVGAVVLGIWKPLGEDNPIWLSACVRVGTVMGALWLALPQLERIPHWLTKAGVLVILVLVTLQGKLRVVLLAVGIYALVVLLRPVIDAIRRPPGKDGESRGS